MLEARAILLSLCCSASAVSAPEALIPAFFCSSCSSCCIKLSSKDSSRRLDPGAASQRGERWFNSEKALVLYPTDVTPKCSRGVVMQACFEECKRGGGNRKARSVGKACCSREGLAYIGLLNIAPFETMPFDGHSWNLGSEFPCTSADPPVVP